MVMLHYSEEERDLHFISGMLKYEGSGDTEGLYEDEPNFFSRMILYGKSFGLLYKNNEERAAENMRS